MLGFLFVCKQSEPFCSTFFRSIQIHLGQTMITIISMVLMIDLWNRGKENVHHTLYSTNSLTRFLLTYEVQADDRNFWATTASQLQQRTCIV